MPRCNDKSSPEHSGTTSARQLICFDRIFNHKMWPKRKQNDGTVQVCRETHRTRTRRNGSRASSKVKYVFLEADSKGACHRGSHQTSRFAESTGKRHPHAHDNVPFHKSKIGTMSKTKTSHVHHNQAGKTISVFNPSRVHEQLFLAI